MISWHTDELGLPDDGIGVGNSLMGKPVLQVAKRTAHIIRSEDGEDGGNRGEVVILSLVPATTQEVDVNDFSDGHSFFFLDEDKS